MNKETLPTRGAETPRVEPFSGNALYYHQGMRQMDGYMTVKEVCALTGLMGKHLYYFHHEHIVRAVAYANYSVEGNDGYKLYDEAGVEKLRQIALFYRLGLAQRDPGHDAYARIRPEPGAAEASGGKAGPEADAGMPDCGAQLSDKVRQLSGSFRRGTGRLH